MAKPDLENGYLRVAHELFAAMACAGFTKWEWVVIREVLNQIFGPRKSKTAIISPTEIARQVSTHKESIVRATRSLVASNVLAKIGGMEYRFLKDYEAWTREGEPRLSAFERAYCESAKTINVSTKRGNNSAPDPSTKHGNDSAHISAERGNNGAPMGNTGAPHGEHGRSQTGTRALPSNSCPPNPPIEEPARGIKKRIEKSENGPLARTLDEKTTGKTGEEHMLFVQVVEELEAYEPTRYLASELIMAADSPGVRGLESWRLFVAARTIQQPNKSKTWGLFQHVAETCTQAQYQKLKRLAPASGEPKAKLYGAHQGP